MPRPHLPLLWLLLVFAMPAGVLAQPAAAHPCAATPRPAERLACYDRAFPPPDTVREAAVARAVEEFGLPHGSRAEVLRNPGQPGHEVEPDRIEARVDRIDAAGGQRWLTLDNGQRWTVPAGTAGPLAPGDPVRISKGALGSHMLRTPGGVSLRARRVH